jgi:hypothetical protein
VASSLGNADRAERYTNVRNQLLQPPSGTPGDEVRIEFRVIVPPGGRAILMHFGVQAGRRLDAQTRATVFAKLAGSS